MRILLVEDDKKLAASIAKNLRAEGFAVDHAYDGLQGEEFAAVNTYDVIILDIGLPLQDGWTTTAHIRRDKITTPILMLTARDDVADKVKGLNSGADDYLTKPFHGAELVARIRALMRRPLPVVQPVIEKFGITFDPSSHRVKRESKDIILSAKEFALLELLMRSPGRIVSRETIMESVWDMNFDPRSNVVDALVKLLRNKMDKGFSKPLIHTLRGIGYQLADKNE
ncbi:MAG: response regulator transcription factor [Chitinivibrionales bacterium]|nr:response regulator transcription factor [Chitinivibrionales bacterium]